jgi:anti-anti-sigma factor
MDIQVEPIDNRRIVHINGKITLEHCPQLQSRLNSILEEDVSEIVIDFNNVPFIDSSGIGELLSLFKQMRERKGGVTLINPNNKLRSLFTMYRFEMFMKIIDRVEPGNE